MNQEIKNQIPEQVRRYLEILKKESWIQEVVSQTEQWGEAITTADWTFLLVWCPTIVSFTQWTIDRAIADNKSDIYYMARDGYLMYRVASYICENRHIDINLHYLRVSRYALRSAQYHLQGESCVDYICTNGIDMTYDKIMRRTGISDNLINRVAERIGYADKRNAILSFKEIVELRKRLRSDYEFLESVYAISRKNYECTIGYLKQEGLMEDKNISLVDTGWIGTIQQTLCQLICSDRDQSTKKPRIDGYYFGLYETPSDADGDTYHSYYFNPKGNISRKAHFANSLMEAIVSAPEAMTMGYSKEKKYVPVTSEYTNPNATLIDREAWILDRYVEWCDISGENGTISTEQIYRLMQLFMCQPTLEEAVFWGNYQFCDDMVESQMQTVAAELTEKDIKNQRFFNKLLHIAGIRRTEIHESAWLEGSIVRCGKHIRTNLNHARAYKRLLYIRKAMKRG